MAAVDYFLKIDGIAGESRDAKHKGEIELESFSWGADRAGSPAAGGGGGAGKVQLESLHITKRFDKASPLLFLACATGKHLKEATLTARKAGKTQLEFLVIKLKDALISGYHSGAASGEEPTESVAFDFARIDVQYTPQLETGAPGPPVKAGWDAKANKSV